MTEYTPKARAKLESYLATHELPEGKGTKESACSIAAINLTLTGKLTDEIPDCMSEVIGKATIALQDAMPHEMRNSKRYKAWLPTAAGTGRDHEQERLDILLDWIWGTVLPQLQLLADEKGFGAEWRKMCEERKADAAYAAGDAAYAAADAAADAARVAAYAAYAAARAAADAIAAREARDKKIREKAVSRLEKLSRWLDLDDEELAAVPIEELASDHRHIQYQVNAALAELKGETDE